MSGFDYRFVSQGAILKHESGGSCQVGVVGLTGSRGMSRVFSMFGMVWCVEDFFVGGIVARVPRGGATMSTSMTSEDVWRGLAGGHFGDGVADLGYGFLRAGYWYRICGGNSRDRCNLLA